MIFYRCCIHCGHLSRTHIPHEDPCAIPHCVKGRTAHQIR
jgi:hypothetical protein